MRRRRATVAATRGVRQWRARPAPAIVLKSAKRRFAPPLYAPAAHAVARQRATHLLAGEDQALLVWGDPFLVLDLGLDIFDRVGRLDLRMIPGQFQRAARSAAGTTKARGNLAWPGLGELPGGARRCSRGTGTGTGTGTGSRRSTATAAAGSGQQALAATARCARACSRNVCGSFQALPARVPLGLSACCRGTAALREWARAELLRRRLGHKARPAPGSQPQAHVAARTLSVPQG